MKNRTHPGQATAGLPPELVRLAEDVKAGVEVSADRVADVITDAFGGDQAAAYAAVQAALELKSSAGPRASIAHGGGGR